MQPLALARPLLALAVFALAPTQLAANEAWIVGCCDADFATTQEAVDAASDGDSILIRTGSPGSFVVDGKSLTIAKDAWFTAPGKPTFSNLEIRNLAAHQKVIVRDVDLMSNGTGLALVRDCAGPVLFEDVEMSLDVADSASVVLTRCMLSGRDGVAGNPTPPASALRIENAAVALYLTIVSGGTGASAGIPPFMSEVFPSQPGAPGVELVSGSLFASGRQIRGGWGGWGHFDGSTCWPSSDGAPGILVGGTVRLMDVDVFGGFTGTDPAPCPQLGETAPALQMNGGTVTTIDETPREFFTLSPGYPGGSVGVQYEGQVGDVAVLLLSTEAGGSYVPALKGAFAPGAPFLSWVLGPVDGSGSIGFSAPVPAAGLPPGLQSVDFHLQLLVGADSGGGLLSPPSFVTLVDP